VPTVLLHRDSEKDRLGREFDVETRTYVGLHRVRQGEHFGAARAAAIDQHQRLLLVHPDPSEVPAFPSAVFDQPAGGEFDAAIGLRITRQIRIGLRQSLAKRGV
jgi:hypothetical protein